jgi:GTP-binding protein HflX
MRALILSELLVANRLFATLDTGVRALHPETQPRILVSDTVGFIRNLPHDLVASFRSALDEAQDASLLLQVVMRPIRRSALVFRRRKKCSERLGRETSPLW